MPNAFKTFPKAKQEQIIEEAVKLCQETWSKINYSSIKRQLDKKYDTNINLGTFRNRFLGKHQSAHKAHADQQLLSRVQEDSLVEWIIHLAECGHAINKQSLRRKTENICGTKPGSTWSHTFLKRHPEIVLEKPSGLDPKRAQAFNRPTVACHFDLLESIIDKHNIPIENIYNMDKKGVQRGGGWKAQAQKYFVPHSKRPKYKLRSGNLELITIVKCVCANGTWIYPGIIFQGKSHYETAWFEVHEKISYVPFNALLLTLPLMVPALASPKMDGPRTTFASGGSVITSFPRPQLATHLVDPFFSFMMAMDPMKHLKCYKQQKKTMLSCFFYPPTQPTSFSHLMLVCSVHFPALGSNTVTTMWRNT